MRRARGLGRWQVVGWSSLVAAIALTLLVPPTLISVGLGVVAVIGLARDPRLGLLPAALLASIAVPYGRAADTGLAAIGGVPLRFQDGVILAAFLFALPGLRGSSRRGTWRSAVVALSIAWLAVGVGALCLGLAEGQPIRDILRDARWWSLYGFVAVAVWSGTSRPALLRGLLAGATIFALVLFATALLPAFDGALKDRAVAYDRGLLRLQFSNGVFVIVAAAWVIDRLSRRLSPAFVAWFGLLAGAVVVSLTRMSLLALGGVVALTALLAVHRHVRTRGRAWRPRRLAIASVVAVPVALAIGALLVATLLGSPAPGAAFVNPIERLLFLGPSGGFDAIARGRGETYRAALEVIGERPLLGHGLGTLVEFAFTPGGARPATPGMQPGVDNAYQTVAMKAGLVGAAVFTALVGWPLVEVARRGWRRWGWYGIAWLAVLGLTATQSFATTGYGPFGLALLMAWPVLRPGRGRASPAGGE
jgi:hypothetical protein